MACIAKTIRLESYLDGVENRLDYNLQDHTTLTHDQHDKTTQVTCLCFYQRQVLITISLPQILLSVTS